MMTPWHAQAKARMLYALTHRDRWEAIHAAPPPPEDVPGQMTFI